MLINLCLIIVVALILNTLFSKCHLPGLLGMILSGVILGPSVFNLISGQVLEVSGELKTAALIVILIRAGLGINKETLNRVGVPAMKMSCIPGIFEGITVTLAAHYLFGLTYIEAGMLGFIIAAVSPAVVVPQMLELKEGGFGKKKEIPTLVLAGASVDDVFAITIFGVFLNLGMGSDQNYSSLFYKVPAGIVIGILIGAAIGLALIWFFKKFEMRTTKQVIIFMIIAIVFHDLCELKTVKDIIPIASLIGIMAIGFVLLEKNDKLANKLAMKFNKIWVLAEILLFALIGSQVRIEVLDASLIGTGLIILCVGLFARSAGVWISLLKSELNNKERLFCVISYLPKATVQAAIGAVPLGIVLDGKMSSMTVESGELILAMAVLSIIVTAPIGAIGIKLAGPRCLSNNA